MNVWKTIDWALTGLFSTLFTGGPQYTPIIPPRTRELMKRYNISEKELTGAFFSKNITTGYAPNATLGVANYYGKVVGAVYRRDQNDRTQWVIIGCFSYQKKTSDWATGRRYWQSWGSRWPWQRQNPRPFSLF